MRSANGISSTHVNQKDVACIPDDAGLQLVLPFVHLLEPLPRDGFILFDAGELRIGE